MASGAPTARWAKGWACHRSNAARAAWRRCWWASSSTWLLRRASLLQTPDVVVPGQLVDELRALDEAPHLEHEQPGQLLVSQQHADRLVLLHDRFELADRGRVVDHHLRAHRHWKLDDLPEVRGCAGEEGKAPGLAPVESGPHVGLDLGQVVVHRSVPVGPLSRFSEHGVELVLDVLVAGQSAPVHVQVTRRDRSGIPSDPCELTDGGFGKDGHSTSTSRIRRS